MSLANIYPNNGDSLHLEGIASGEVSELSEERPYVIVQPNQEQLEEAYRLRAEVYHNELKIIDEHAVREDGLDIDIYDETSEHIIVISDEGVVGNVRLIPKSEDAPLPAEEFFDIEAPEGSVEASRYIVRTDKRGQSGGFAVSLALIREGVRKAIEDDAPYIYMTIEDDLMRHFVKFGMPLEQVSEKKYIEKYKTVNAAYRFDPRELVASAWKEDTTLRETGKGTLVNRRIRVAPFLIKGMQGENQNFGSIDLGYDAKAVERNLGFLTKEEQEKILESSVSIAGTGGDGGMLALQLARMGVKNFKLADPEKFELENLNRQAASTYMSLGKNKAEVVAQAILAINPHANVEVYPQGVTEDNIADFIEGSDLVIDETEFTMPELGVMIARESRTQKKNVLMALNIGFGCYVTSFDGKGEKGQTFEAMMGLSEDTPLKEITQAEVPLERWVGHVPTYADLGMLSDVSAGEISAPSVAPGVSMAAGVATTEAIWHILDAKNRPQPTFSPECLSFDAVDGFEKVEDTSEGFRRTLGALALKAQENTA